MRVEERCEERTRAGKPCRNGHSFFVYPPEGLAYAYARRVCATHSRTLEQAGWTLGSIYTNGLAI